MTVGSIVRVVSQTDDTLKDVFLGRIGRVLDSTTYQQCGDSPPEDPFIAVQHAQHFGRASETNFYWTEELEEVA